MPGPPPKDPTIRQRRNRASTAGTLDGEPRRRRPPALPKRDPTVKQWHAMTKAWWKDIWTSPMAPKFVKADRHGLFILAELVDQFWYNPCAEQAREIRLQGARYGESPLDRWRLQWSVKDGQEQKAKPAEQPRVAPAEDPRKVLAMVKR